MTQGYGINTHEYKRPLDYFFEEDELYETKESVVQRPEFYLMSKENFNLSEGAINPMVTMMSDTGPNELPPIQPDAPMDYNLLHSGLESWSIFRCLPILLKFDR